MSSSSFNRFWTLKISLSSSSKAPVGDKWLDDCDMTLDLRICLISSFVRGRGRVLNEEPYG
jgi:hypothetical protein